MEDKVLYQILEQLRETKTSIQVIQQDLAELKTDVVTLKVGQANLENKLDIIFKQTAQHMEFGTETRIALEDIKNELIYITHKEVQNEKELIQIKSHLKIIK